MSCHDIGRGMDSVAKVVASMYIKKEITKDVAIRLFKALRSGVNYCDGNEYEAVESLSELLCGCCLEQFTKTNAPLYIWDELDEYYSKFEKGEEISSEAALKCEDLYKSICDKKGFTYGDTFRNQREFHEILREASVSDYICEKCFERILKKYLKSK